MIAIGDFIYDLLCNIYVLGLTCGNISKNVFANRGGLSNFGKFT